MHRRTFRRQMQCDGGADSFGCTSDNRNLICEFLRQKNAPMLKEAKRAYRYKIGATGRHAQSIDARSMWEVMTDESVSIMERCRGFDIAEVLIQRSREFRQKPRE
jgi:hypothetical protein